MMSQYTSASPHLGAFFRNDGRPRDPGEASSPALSAGWRHPAGVHESEVAGMSFLIVDDNRHTRNLVKSILHAFGVKRVAEAEDGADALIPIIMLRTERRPRILFVDDEPHVLDGLRRSLRTVDVDWDLDFVTSGERALAVMDEHPCDVLVTDIMMPQMDGTALLEQVLLRFPVTVPVVLSGHCDQEKALSLIRSGYPFLSKPCPKEHLVATLTMIVDRRPAESPAGHLCLSLKEALEAITLLAAGMIRGGLVKPNRIPWFLRDRLIALLVANVRGSVGEEKVASKLFRPKDDDIHVDNTIQVPR